MSTLPRGWLHFSLPKWLYGLVYFSRFDEAFLTLLLSPGPGTGRIGRFLPLCRLFWTSASKLKVTPHIFFWSVAEASHEQKAAPGDFPPPPPWISLFRACLLALDKNCFSLLGKIESHGFSSVCSSPAPLSDDEDG